jgi:uncharacterized protein
MIGIDTNILLYALHSGVDEHSVAKQFLSDLGSSQEVVICELVLAELYQLIRNPRVFGREVSPQEAAVVIQRLRTNPNWLLVENAPVMEEVWHQSAQPGFARRRLFDVRLAFTLQYYGVTQFATANVKDFKGLGFERVWSPVVAARN